MPQLRAGIPNCIVSFVCDNPFWGDRLQNLNVGSHVPSRAVNTEVLTECVKRLYSPAVKEACLAMQKSMLQEEDGTQVLVRELYKRMPASGEIKVDWAAKAAAGARASMLSTKNVTSLLLLLLLQGARVLPLGQAVQGACMALFLGLVGLVQYYDVNILGQGAFDKSIGMTSSKS